jgi:hypothetical protein
LAGVSSLDAGAAAGAASVFLLFLSFFEVSADGVAATGVAAAFLAEEVGTAAAEDDFGFC